MSEPFFGTELGTGIVAKSNTLLGYNKCVTNAKDLSNLYAQLKVIYGEVAYSTGFSRKKKQTIQH